jgi:hypothetical protein
MMRGRLPAGEGVRLPNGVIDRIRVPGDLIMGAHRHENFVAADEAEMPLAEQDLELGVPFVSESEFEFFSRRALEEARLAQRATSPAAANAHRYLAAVYSERLARHISVHDELERLLSAIS